MTDNIPDILDVDKLFTYGEDEDYFPKSSIIIDPYNSHVLGTFLGGNGAVAVTRDKHFIFFDNPECADNYHQLDFTLGRFTISSNTLGGRFEEVLHVEDLEELEIANELITRITQRYSIINKPNRWDEFYEKAKEIFAEPDGIKKYGQGGITPFLALEYLDTYLEDKELIDLLDAEQQDLAAINKAIIERMTKSYPEYESDQDEVEIVTYNGRIVYVEFPIGLHDKFTHRTQEALNNKIKVSSIHLSCLRGEPEGDRLSRELDD